MNPFESLHSKKRQIISFFFLSLGLFVIPAHSRTDTHVESVIEKGLISPNGRPTFCRSALLFIFPLFTQQGLERTLIIKH